MHRENFKKYLRYFIWALPLVGTLVSSFAPISARSQQFLVMILLIWFQTFIIFEVFRSGR